jgi:hypothetical protein
VLGVPKHRHSRSISSWFNKREDKLRDIRMSNTWNGIIARQKQQLFLEKHLESTKKQSFLQSEKDSILQGLIAVPPCTIVLGNYQTLSREQSQMLLRTKIWQKNGGRNRTWTSTIRLSVDLLSILSLPTVRMDQEVCWFLDRGFWRWIYWEIFTDIPGKMFRV